MAEQVEGQYGDFAGLKVGDEVVVSISGFVVEVGTNYAELDLEGGDELSVNMDWKIEKL